MQGNFSGWKGHTQAYRNSHILLTYIHPMLLSLLARIVKVTTYLTLSHQKDRHIHNVDSVEVNIVEDIFLKM